MSPRLPLPPIVLITGATGWVGRRIVCALVAGLPDYPSVFHTTPKIRALVLTGERCDELRQLGIEIAVGDIRDPDALKRFVRRAEGGLLIHVAGIIHPPGRTRYFDEINHLGTVGLLSAAKHAGIQRMIVMSSNSPLGANPTPDATFSEESPYAPYMGYGRSKWKMEVALRQAMTTGKTPELVIIRAPWFYGPGQPPRQSLFFSLVKEGRFPIVGSGENKRSMAYTDNLAAGLLLAAVCPEAAGQIFWIADKRPYSMREIVTAASAVLEEDFGMTVKKRLIRLPAMVADAARLVDAVLQGAGLYHQKIHVLSEMNLTIACRIDKAQRVLGYEPMVELREGMRRSVQWCIDNHLVI